MKITITLTESELKAAVVQMIESEGDYGIDWKDAIVAIMRDSTTGEFGAAIQFDQKLAWVTP